MTKINPSAQASFRRSLQKRGRWVIVRRVSGNAPAATKTEATVRAIVAGYVPEKPVIEVMREGAITQGARRVMLLQDDLAKKSFPLPLAKNDRIILADDVETPSADSVAAGEALNVLMVDPYKRAIAGAVELLAVGTR